MHIYYSSLSLLLYCNYQRSCHVQTCNTAYSSLWFKLCFLKCVLWVRMASSWRHCNGNGSFVFCLTRLGLIPIYPDNWGMTEVPTSLSYWYSKSKNITIQLYNITIIITTIKKGKYACLLKYIRCIDWIWIVVQIFVSLYYYSIMNQKYKYDIFWNLLLALEFLSFLVVQLEFDSKNILISLMSLANCSSFSSPSLSKFQSLQWLLKKGRKARGSGDDTYTTNIKLGATADW